MEEQSWPLVQYILVIAIDEGGLAYYETLILEDEEDSIPKLIAREMFSREYWFGTGVTEYIEDNDTACYNPVSCFPDACASCHKVDREAFARKVVDHINDVNTGWQYIFFTTNALGCFEELKITY